MKLFFTFLILPFIVSCTSTDDVTLSYSAIFKISLAAEQLSGGTIFYSDELSIKSNRGTLVSGKIISTASEGLPETLDIRQYPEYILGLKEMEGESTDVGELFRSSSREIKSSYDFDTLNIAREAEHTTYSLCKSESCLAFMVKNNFEDHIFTIHASGYAQKDFIELLKGAVHVN